MKVLIWIACVFFGTKIMDLVENCFLLFGISLGAIPIGLLYCVTVGSMIKVAIIFCKEWDLRKAKKALNDAVSKGMSAIDFVKSKTPGAFLDQLEWDRENEFALKNYLGILVREKKLPKVYADILFVEYMQPRNKVQGE